MVSDGVIGQCGRFDGVEACEGRASAPPPTVGLAPHRRAVASAANHELLRGRGIPSRRETVGDLGDGDNAQREQRRGGPLVWNPSNSCCAKHFATGGARFKPIETPRDGARPIKIKSTAGSVLNVSNRARHFADGHIGCVDVGALSN